MSEIGTYEQAMENLESFAAQVLWHRPLEAERSQNEFDGRHRRCHEFVLKDKETGMWARVQIPWCGKLEAFNGHVWVNDTKFQWSKAVDEVREMLRPTHTIP
jgi:hypothetical protein